MSKIAIISTHPAPYRDSFLRALVHEDTFDIDVYSLFSYDKGQSYWGLKDGGYHPINLHAERHSLIFTTLKLLHLFVFSHKYEFVLWPCWAYKCLKLPIFLSAVLGRKYALGADSVAQEPLMKVLMAIKTYVIKHAQFIFVPGRASQEFFLKQFSLKPNQILLGAYSLEGERLECEILARRKNKDIIREKLDIPCMNIVYLMVANMIPTRHYPITVCGFLKFAQNHHNVTFLAVGNGSDYEDMKKLADKNAAFKVLPGCAFDEMLSLYAISDVYVHGGREPASTALIIGSLAHLPLMSSDAVGCSMDVLRDGETGYCVANYKDENDWKEAFEKSFMTKTEWERMGIRARELSKNLDIDAVIGKFIQKLTELVKS